RRRVTQPLAADPKDRILPPFGAEKAHRESEPVAARRGLTDPRKQREVLRDAPEVARDPELADPFDRGRHALTLGSRSRGVGRMGTGRPNARSLSSAALRPTSRRFSDARSV